MVPHPGDPGDPAAGWAAFAMPLLHLSRMDIGIGIGGPWVGCLPTSLIALPYRLDQSRWEELDASMGMGAITFRNYRYVLDSKLSTATAVMKQFICSP